MKIVNIIFRREGFKNCTMETSVRPKGSKEMGNKHPM